MNNRLVETVAVVILCGIANGTASAQTPPRRNVGMSYSFLHLIDDEGDNGLNMPAGWLVSFAQPVTRTPVWIVGEAAGNYKSEFGETLHLHTFQGGVRLSGLSRQPVMPFAQVLAGVMTLGCCGESDGYFSIEPGGGVDIALSPQASVRFTASFPTAFYEGDTGKTFRFQMGVVLPLKR